MLSVRLVSLLPMLLLSSCLVTSVAAGRVGDIIGRKGTLFIGALVFTIGGAIQTFTTGFAVMVLGRIISGFGVGLLSFVDSFQDIERTRLTRPLQNYRSNIPE